MVTVTAAFAALAVSLGCERDELDELWQRVEPYPLPDSPGQLVDYVRTMLGELRTDRDTPIPAGGETA